MSRYATLLLTGLLIIIGCSDDIVSPEPESTDRIAAMCISYYDKLNHDLKFSIRKGESWGEPTIISSVYDVGQWPSLALDSRGHAHISHYDASHGNLKYIYEKNCGYGWLTETIDFSGWVGSYTSLALDAGGHPHISYYNGSNGTLKHATKKSGCWITETVDNVGPTGMYTSLAIDAEGNPHISYCDNSNKDLKYASKIDGYWIIETVDSDGSVGWHTSLALDANGNPHISYCEQDFVGSIWELGCTLTGALKYAVKTDSRWDCEMVDRANGQYSSLILDAQGNPHISYYMYDLSCQCDELTGYDCDCTISGVPKYAGKIEGYWILETIYGGFQDQQWSCPSIMLACEDFFSMVPLNTSIALDTSGIPFISFYDWANGDLKCAMKIGNFWVVDTVDDEGDVGSFSSIAAGSR